MKSTIPKKSWVRKLVSQTKSTQELLSAKYPQLNFFADVDSLSMLAPQQAGAGGTPAGSQISPSSSPRVAGAAMSAGGPGGGSVPSFAGSGDHGIKPGS